MTDTQLIDWLAQHAGDLDILKDDGVFLATLRAPGTVLAPRVRGGDFRLVISELAALVPRNPSVLCATCHGDCVLPGCPTCGVTYGEYHRARLNRPIVEAGTH